MTTNPNSYRSFPAYNNGAGYALGAFPSTNQKPAYSYPMSAAGLPYRSPNSNLPALSPYASPYYQTNNASSPVPVKPLPNLQSPGATTITPVIGSAPQQPMVISMTAPKLTKDEMHKRFWLIAGGGTLSIIAGSLFGGWVALKILPQRIAAEMGTQTHKSMLNTLDKVSFGRILTRIKNKELAFDSKRSDELYAKWHNREAEKIHRSEEERDKFLKDIGRHLSVSDLAALISQQVFRKTFTPEFVKEQSHNFSDALLSNTAKQTLLRKVADQETIKRLLDVHGTNEKDFIKLGEAERNAIMAEVYKHTSTSDCIGVAAAEATETALRHSLVTEQNLTEALNTPSITKTLADQKKDIAKMSKERKFRFVQQHITVQDALKLNVNNAAQETTSQTLTQLKSALANIEKMDTKALDDLLETPDFNHLPNKPAKTAKDEAKRRFIEKHLSFTQASGLHIQDPAVQKALQKSVDNAIQQVYGNVLNLRNLDEAIESIPSLSQNKNKLKNIKDNSERLKAAQGLLTLQDASNALVRGALSDAIRSSLSPQAKENLLKQVENNPSVQEALQTYNPENKKLHELGNAEQAAILDKVHQHVSISDYLSSVSAETLKKALITDRNLDKAWDSPSVVSQLENKDIRTEMTEAQQMEYVLKHISVQDAFSVFGRTSASDIIEDNELIKTFYDQMSSGMKGAPGPIGYFGRWFSTKKE